MTAVGFIGLGRMGQGMAHNLLRAGVRLTVHDPREELAAPLIAAEVDVLFTSLPGPAEFEQVVLDAGGLVETLRPGLTLCDVVDQLARTRAPHTERVPQPRRRRVGRARQRRSRRRSPLDMLVNQVLPAIYEPPASALRLAHKDVALATDLGRELGVPMRLANLTLEEMTEALARGLGEQDTRAFLKLQFERAGVDVAVDPERLRRVLEELRS